MKEVSYQEFSRKLIPDGAPIIGIRVPKLRSLAREIASSDYLNFLSINSVYHEEKILKGLVIGYLKTTFTEVLTLLHQFLLEIDNWAVCDVAVSNLKIFKKNLDNGFVFLKQCLETNKTYQVRFALVMMLSYYLVEDYLNQVFRIISEVNIDDYYVKMANAWLISIAYIKFPEQTISLFDGRLDLFTHNKAISKITDSFRVTEEQKTYLKTLRRK